MAAYTTTNLLTSIRNRGNIPSTSNDNNVNSDANLLITATEQLLIKLYPLLQSTREEFYVARKDFTVTAAQNEYVIPSRASGLVVRDIQWIDGNNVSSLPIIDSERISTTNSGTVEGYYLEHNKIILYPTPSATSGTMRVRYFLRPSRLAATGDCAQISSIDTGTNQITVSSIPSTWATGSIIDLIQQSAPYANLAIDQTTTNVSGSVITLSSLPSTLAVGDWVALAEYSPIPQIPMEFQAILSQLTVVKTLEAMGDREAATYAFKDLQTDLKNMMTLVTPRNQGERKKVISRSWT
jgi:hypothetical protein